MFNKLTALAFAALVALSTASAYAELSAAGPANPTNGFPSWYQDSNGVALEIGLDPLFNFFDPPIAGNNFSQQIGFGAEAFWFLSDAIVDMPVSPALPVGGQAIVVMAVEAAFATGDPVNGQQFPFNRLRIRIDAPFAGTYIVTHPYGVDTFTVDVPGIKAINSTIDIGGVMPDSLTALTGRIGPFLKAVSPAPPLGFIGNSNILQTVTGSPFGTNFFRVQGPGGIDVQTDQFTLGGKIFTGVIGAPLTVQRATYRISDHAAVDIIATSAPTARLSISGLTTLPAAMVGNGTGKFYRHIHGATTPLPAVVTVTASNTGNTDTAVIKELVDAVQITTAEYDRNTRVLTINAVSGDTVANPVLTAVGFGPLAAGTLSVADVLVPPDSVTVTSAKGGSDTRNVSIVELGPPPANTPPAAAGDTANTNLNTAAIINVLANDVDVDGFLAPETLTIISAPISGTAVKNLDNTITYTPALGFIGQVTFNYTVQDDLGAVSNTATVTVNVVSATPAPNLPPVANDDAVSTIVSSVEVVFNLIANDTDADGAIDPASLSIVTTPLSGTVVNNLDGTVSYTPNVGFVGIDTFTYTVRDTLGALSNTATVTVTIKPVEVVTVTRALFRISGAIWVVRGTNSLANPTITMTIKLVRTGQVIGKASVDTLGNWSLSVRGSTAIAQAGDTVTAESSNGITASLPVTIVN